MVVTHSSSIAFMKMHGLGNDFVVVDERDGMRRITRDVAVAMADRHRGIGFDQLAVMSNNTSGDAHLTFWNSDGSTAGACGNATRCIARFLMSEKSLTEVTLTTEHGTLEAHDEGGLVSVNMGHPQLTWDTVPLAQDVDLDALPIEGAPVATGMGNPHCTFFVEDAETIDLEREGAKFEHHRLFPQRTNVQFASITGKDRIRMRVWERGVGVTLASGSSSCATAVAAARLGLTGRKVRIDLEHGHLDIHWSDKGVWMTGPTAHVFDGQWHG